jgi:hypothetical protein
VTPIITGMNTAAAQCSTNTTPSTASVASDRLRTLIGNASSFGGSASDGAACSSTMRSVPSGKGVGPDRAGPVPCVAAFQRARRGRHAARAGTGTKVSAAAS